MAANGRESAAGYRGDQVELVKATCLYLATTLGDLMDETVIVGGLVPTMLVDQTTLPPGAGRHVGTMDLDLGLKLALLDEGRYHTLSERLRNAGFAPDRNERDHLTRQRWRHAESRDATIDFLIPPSRATDSGGRLRHLEGDFAAFMTPGLSLAFRDCQSVLLEGTTIRGEKASRQVPVCGPGAFVVLKSLAFDGRGYNKDAYDLFYLVRNYGRGVRDVAERLKPLLDDAHALTALAVLRRDFLDPDGTGPRRVAQFLWGRSDADTQADVVGFVGALLAEVSQTA